MIRKIITDCIPFTQKKVRNIFCKRFKAALRQQPTHVAVLQLLVPVLNSVSSGVLKGRIF
jgi:hypothetical protein